MAINIGSKQGFLVMAICSFILNDYVLAKDASPQLKSAIEKADRSQDELHSGLRDLDVSIAKLRSIEFQKVATENHVNYLKRTQQSIRARFQANFDEESRVEKQVSEKDAELAELRESNTKMKDKITEIKDQIKWLRECRKGNCYVPLQKVSADRLGLTELMKDQKKLLFGVDEPLVAIKPANKLIFVPPLRRDLLPITHEVQSPSDPDEHLTDLFQAYAKKTESLNADTRKKIRDNEAKMKNIRSELARLESEEKDLEEALTALIDKAQKTGPNLRRLDGQLVERAQQIKSEKSRSIKLEAQYKALKKKAKAIGI